MDPTLSERHHRYRVKAGRTKAALYARVVENKRYTMRQIANELGVSMTTADTRVKRGPYPLTWESLRQARLPANSKDMQA
ncbi:leucine zipper domain-containing protein [Stenotrophomonas maltophilia]|uniref:leucine zipper domain-containing protein n=1 Tax=Stenotrophomonas maltophilia TaxID=40324 RepID=UPI001FA6F406|nr:leucine zipper domain-containing protein [Stenotrophomonas maltophilia]